MWPFDIYYSQLKKNVNTNWGALRRKENLTFSLLMNVNFQIWRQSKLIKISSLSSALSGCLPAWCRAAIITHAQVCKWPLSCRSLKDGISNKPVGWEEERRDLWWGSWAEWEQTSDESRAGLEQRETIEMKLMCFYKGHAWPEPGWSTSAIRWWLMGQIKLNANKQWVQSVCCLHGGGLTLLSPWRSVIFGGHGEVSPAVGGCRQLALVKAQLQFICLIWRRSCQNFIISGSVSAQPICTRWWREGRKKKHHLQGSLPSCTTVLFAFFHVSCDLGGICKCANCQWCCSWVSLEVWPLETSGKMQVHREMGKELIQL